MTAPRRAVKVFNRNVAESASISVAARMVYIIMCGRADDDGVCTVDNCFIAAAVGVSERHVIRLIKELEERGVIEREARFENHRQQSSETRLVEAPTTRAAAFYARGGGDTHVRGEGDTHVTQKQSPLKRTKNISHGEAVRGVFGPSTSNQEVAPKPQCTESPRQRRERDEKWSEFYSLYPRKAAPEDCFKAWTKLIKDGEDPDRIIASLRQQVEWLTYEATREPGNNYCPYPARWLRAGQFDLDEVTVRERTSAIKPMGRDAPFDPKRETRDEWLVRAGYA